MSTCVMAPAVLTDDELDAVVGGCNTVGPVTVCPEGAVQEVSDLAAAKIAFVLSLLP